MADCRRRVLRLNAQWGALAVAALVLPLIACSPEPTPTLVSTPTPAFTPSPVYTPSPTPIDVPEPSPSNIEACSNGRAVPNPEDNSGLVRDCAILLEARDILVGPPPSDYDLDWSSQLSITKWKGIDLAGGRVVGIVLESYTVEQGDVASRFALGGSISPALGGLTALRELDLSDNTLRGEIPSSLANLTRLESLDLSYNYLMGELPSSLASLTRLEHLGKL